MVKNMSHKLWFSILDKGRMYQGEESCFIAHDSFSWASDFSAHFEQIKNELTNYLLTHQPKAYFRSGMVTRESSYKTFSLRWWDIEFFKNQVHFPVTIELLKKYPEITTLSFNFLEPQSRILPHCGDTNAIYRCHFGVEIPDSLPICGFRVKNETRSWKEGEWFAFMDAYEHEAFNMTDQTRMIILMDILRPEYANQRSRITSTVMTSLFLQKRAERFKWLKRLPHPAVRILVVVLRPIAALAIRWVNFTKRY
jgi:ornithine lipid ester-linked acyl 2-hydroxylase